MSSFEERLKRYNERHGESSTTPAKSGTSFEERLARYNERNGIETNPVSSATPETPQPKVNYDQNQYTAHIGYTDTGSRNYSREDILRMLADAKVAQEQERQRETAYNDTALKIESAITPPKAPVGVPTIGTEKIIKGAETIAENRRNQLRGVLGYKDENGVYTASNADADYAKISKSTGIAEEDLRAYARANDTGAQRQAYTELANNSGMSLQEFKDVSRKYNINDADAEGLYAYYGLDGLRREIRDKADSPYTAQSQYEIARYIEKQLKDRGYTAYGYKSGKYIMPAEYAEVILRETNAPEGGYTAENLADYPARALALCAVDVTKNPEWEKEADQIYSILYNNLFSKNEKWRTGGDIWTTVANNIRETARPTAVGIMLGLAKGLGSESIAKLISEDVNEKFDTSYARVSQLAPTATNISNTVGTIGLYTALAYLTGGAASSVAGAGASVIGANTASAGVKLATAGLTGAMTFGSVTALQNLGDYARGNINIDEYSKRVGQSEIVGTATSLASGLARIKFDEALTGKLQKAIISNAGENFTSKIPQNAYDIMFGGDRMPLVGSVKNPQTVFYYFTRNMASGLAGSGAFIASNALITGEAPTPEQVAYQFAFGFVSSLVHSFIEAHSVSAAQAEYARNIEERIGQIDAEMQRFYKYVEGEASTRPASSEGKVSAGGDLGMPNASDLIVEIESLRRYLVASIDASSPNAVNELAVVDYYLAGLQETLAKYVVNPSTGAPMGDYAMTEQLNAAPIGIETAGNYATTEEISGVITSALDAGITEGAITPADIVRAETMSTPVIAPVGETLAPATAQVSPTNTVEENLAAIAQGVPIEATQTTAPAQEITRPAYEAASVQPVTAETREISPISPAETASEGNFTSAKTDARNVQNTTPRTETAQSWEVIGRDFGENGQKAFAEAYDPQLTSGELGTLAEAFTAFYNAGKNNTSIGEISDVARINRDVFGVFGDANDAAAFEEAALTAGNKDRALTIPAEKGKIDATLNRIAAFAEGGENENGGQESGARIRGGTVRNALQSTRGQAGEIYGKQGENRARRTGNAEGEGRQDRGRGYGLSQEARGKRVSLYELGVNTGTDKQSVKIAADISRRALKDSVKNGWGYVEFEGEGEVYAGDGKTEGVEGVSFKFNGKDWIAVRKDSSRFTRDQLYDHEKMHKEIARGRVNLKTLAKTVVELAENDQNLLELVHLYAMAYDATMPVDEWLEELCCDAKANMDRFGAEGAKKAMDTLRREIGKAYEQSRGTKATGGDSVAFSRGKDKSYDFSKSFGEQIDDYKNGVFPRSDTLVVRDTPKVFRKIGMNALPMTYTQKHLREALANKNGNHLGEALLREVPNALEHPVAIIDSETVPGRVVAIIELSGKAQSTIAAVEIDGKGWIHGNEIDSNAITSIHSRGNTISWLLSNAIKSELNGRGGIYYWDKNKALNADGIDGVQFPSGSTLADGFIRSITDPLSKVNPKIENIFETKQFKRWFGNSKVVNEDGTPKVVYHGTDAEFTVFDRTKGRSSMDIQGMFFSPWELEAKGYGPNVGAYYLSLKNPAPEGVAYKALNMFKGQNDAGVKAREYLEKLGYDGVNNGDEEYIAFYPSQIKSATDNIGTFDGNNPDVRYSLLTDEIAEIRRRMAEATAEFDLSERELLTNALETVSDEKELAFLEKYRSKVEKLNAWEAEAKQLRKDMMSGNLDAAGYKAAQAEAARLENLVNSYDKRLITSIEANKPLQDVLKRERKKAFRQGREEQQLKQKEREAGKILRERIKGIAKDFNERLQKPTERRWVPDNLLKGVIDVAEMIDPTGPREGTKVKERFASMKNALDSLKSAYDKIAQVNDAAATDEFDAEFSAMIGDLADVIGDTPVRDMSFEQLQDVYAILNDIRAMVNTANKIIRQNETYGVYEAGRDIINEQNDIIDKKLNARGAVGWMRERFVNPMRAALEMSGFDRDSQLYQLFKDLDDGRKRGNLFRMSAEKELEATRQTKADKKKYTDAVEKPVDFGVKDIYGNPLLITKMQAMQLLMTYYREQTNPNRRHLENHVFFPDVRLQAKGKFQEAYDKAKIMPALTPDTLNRIIEGLDEWDKRYLSAAKRVLYEIAPNAINETTMQTKHRPVATEKNYIPYEIMQDYIAKESENVNFNKAVANMGMLKSVVPNAGQPLVMRGLNAILDKHISDAAKVYAYSIPVRNFNKVFNMRLTDDEGGTPLKLALRNAWGSKGTNLLDQAVADVQGPRPGDLNRFFEFIRGGMVVSTLANNISVWMKQAASYPTAGSILSQKALAKGLKDYAVKIKDGIHARDVWNEIDEHTAEHYIRRLGLSSQELGELNQSKGWQNKLNSKLGKASPMNWIQSMDVATTAALWYACKAEVESKGVTESDASYWDNVTKLYEQVLGETQPMYDSLHRAEVTKEKSFVRNLVMFQTQPLQNSGILRVAGLELKAARKQFGKNSTEAKEAGKAFRKAVSSQLASHFVFTAMTLLAAMLMHRMNPYRDEEDGEVTPEAVAKGFGKNFGKSLFGAIFPVIGNYATSIAERVTGQNNYDVLSDSVVDKVNDLVNAFGKIKNPTYNNYMTIATEIASLFGIPAGNARKIVEGGINHVKDIINGEFGSFESGYERTSKQTYNRLYNAYKNGDENYEKYLEEALASGKSESDIKEAIESRIKKEKGYNTVVEMRGSERYIFPEGEVMYDAVVQQVKSSKLWSDLSASSQAKLEDLAYDVATADHWQDKEIVKENNLSAAEYILYKLALDIVDEPNKNGKYGTYTNAEKEKAVKMAKGG